MSVKYDFSTLETGFEALWPVKVMVPKKRGGGHEEQTFEALFRHVSIEELEACRDKIAEPGSKLDYKSIPALYFVGLAPEEKATWSDALRDKMLSVRWVREGLERAYAEFAGGDPARKN